MKITYYSVMGDAVMNKLALLLLALPLAACTTAQQTAGAGNCDPRWPGYDICKNGANGGHVALSHWQVATGNGRFLATGAEASAASTGPQGPPYGR